MINKRILNTDEKSDSLKQKINQIESQLDVLIDDYPNYLQGKSMGLITNYPAVSSSKDSPALA